ncbi:MAG: M18 family aminopeptidase [Clostridia bacterium]|nr:M18 family aminopeptidase [Clostridia bacterium]
MGRYTKQEEVQGLLNYINHAPTPYHSTEYLASMLDEAGAVRLMEQEPWGDVLPGIIYYFLRNDSALVAFRLGDRSPAETGWRISAAHHDAPGFRIKPAGSNVSGSYERLCVEPYGGLITQSWLDRPLGLAGRVYTKSSYDDGVSGINVNIQKPILTIPGLAIHFRKDKMEAQTLNPQTQLMPFLAQDFEGRKSFHAMLAEESLADEADILSFDLMPYDLAPACLTGLSGEFISAPRLDDYAMAYSVFRGFIEAADASEISSIAIAFDHEECGSQTDRGGKSDLLGTVLERISEKLDFTREDSARALANSILASADMAHATHPAFPDATEPDHLVYLNSGPVLKESAGQSYVTSPKASAFFRKMCEDHEIPYQVFSKRNDVRGGSTMGPMLAARYGTLAMDVGSPLLSMHSIRETGGSLDVYYATELFEALNQ